jgi:cytochrome c oxidase assembly protein subunit 15
VATAAVWALALTIISGAAVRLTGSGLGCTTWPSCTSTSVVAPLHFHAWVEFGNRLITAFVSVASLAAPIAAWKRAPRRRDLQILSLTLVAGLIAEILMGAAVVYSKLAPSLVMIHFLLGLAFLAVAVVLHHRSGIPDPEPGQSPPPAVPLVGSLQLLGSRLMLVALTAVVIAGSVVTSTGPHGGSPTARRFDFSLHSVAQLHGSCAEVFLLITLVMLWGLNHTGAPRPVLRRAQIVFAALVAQAGVGYTQYFNGDPVGLVAVHVAGASLLVITVIQFHLGLWAHPCTAETDPLATSTVSETAVL